MVKRGRPRKRVYKEYFMWAKSSLGESQFEIIEPYSRTILAKNWKSPEDNYVKITIEKVEEQ